MQRPQPITFREPELRSFTVPLQIEIAMVVAKIHNLIGN